MVFEFLNSVFYKSLIGLYKLNINKNGRAKSLLIDAIFNGLVIQRDGLNMALLEMALESATDDWLDYWGNTFGVSRDYKEDDDVYRKRIIEEIISPKNTLESIKRAAARKINKDYNESLLPESIRIFEPWTELIKLDDRGYLDGSGRLISYDYWIYSVIDVALPDSHYITPDLIKYLNKIKSAGVKVVFSIAPRWDVITDIDRVVRNTHVWNKVYRVHNIQINNVNNFGFKTAPVGRLDKIIKDLDNSIIDGPGLLEGRQVIYWNGIEFSREFAATGVIRNHLGGYLSLEDYAALLENDNPTIGQALDLEQESFDATRENEGKLTSALKPIEIKTERK